MAGLSLAELIDYMHITNAVETIGYEKTLQQIVKTNILITDKGRKYKGKRFIRHCIADIERIYEEIYRNIIAGNCVSIACYIFEVLLTKGYSPVICIGVNDADKNINAHMWVECDGFTLDLPCNTERYRKIRAMTVDSIKTSLLR